MKPFFLNKTADRPLVLASLIAFVSALPAKKAFKVEITEQRHERTLQQNKALFGLAYPILSAATGFTVDELHEAFCKRLFGSVDRIVFGQTVSKPYRTTTTDADGKRDVIDWETFSRFYDMVGQVAAECDVQIPDPDPTWRQRERFAA